MQNFWNLPKQRRLNLIQKEMVRREIERRGLLTSVREEVQVEAVTGSRVGELRGNILAVQRYEGFEAVLTGPGGTGKSIGILHKLHTLAEKHPNVRFLILRKTRASLTESGMVTFEDKVLPENHPVRFGARGQRIERKNRTAYHYPNGGTIVVGGLDEATRLFSTEYDIIYVQECTEISLEDWESLLRALRNNKLGYHQLLGDCNPDVPHHWIKQRAESGSLELLETRHEDNPGLYDLAARAWTPFGVQYIAVLDRLTGTRKQRLRYGKWVASEGQVYEAFDAAIHVIPRFEIPAEWRRIRVVDFGYTNPFVCLWLAIDHDGRVYLYREIYMTKRIVRVHARTILEHSEGEVIEATVCDHDAEDRATLEAEGIPTVAAYKAIRTGIEAVQDRLSVQEDEKARLYILEGSLIEADEALVIAKKPFHTAMEFVEYAFPKGADGKPVKEVPLDINNHGMDAVRYGVAWIDDLAHENKTGWAL